MNDAAVGESAVGILQAAIPVLIHIHGPIKIAHTLQAIIHLQRQISQREHSVGRMSDQNDAQSPAHQLQLQAPSRQDQSHRSNDEGHDQPQRPLQISHKHAWCHLTDQQPSQSSTSRHEQVKLRQAR